MVPLLIRRQRREHYPPRVHVDGPVHLPHERIGHPRQRPPPPGRHPPPHPQITNTRRRIIGIPPSNPRQHGRDRHRIVLIGWQLARSEAATDSVTLRCACEIVILGDPRGDPVERGCPCRQVQLVQQSLQL